VNNIMTWFCRLLRVLVIVDFIVGLLALFFPNTTLRLFGLSPTDDITWTACAGMMWLAIALLICPAVKDPYRYHLTAKYAVVTRGLMALFLLILWPGRYVLLGVIDLILFLILWLLFWLGSKEPHAEWQATTT